LAIPVAGAYQLSMASNYNLAPRPAVLWLEQDRVEVLQQREFPEQSGWWVSGQV
jgi:diaminopimelate decarboxylase